MRHARSILTLGALVALTLGCDSSGEGAAEELGEQSITVELCDGETTVQVAPGQATTPDDGRRIADALMDQWRQANPDEKWGEDNPAHAIVEPADNSDVISRVAEGEEPTQGPGHSYGDHTAREVAVWDREIRRAVAEGDRVFHDGDALGSTIAVSCDMCHPNAANTHAETYPKYQVQLGRVALLRDMINWCLQHPVRAEAMEADDPRMRAMEAYIYAQRRGHELNYGRR